MNIWEDPHSPWKSQAAYFTWLRGNLRRIWMRSPISNRFKSSLCRKPKPSDGVSKRVKSVGDCSRCGKVFAKSSLEVDHVIPAGSIRCWEDVAGFVERLLGCASKHLRLICKPCHKIVTHAERYSCTEEDAINQKLAIEFSKLPAATQKAKLRQLKLPEGKNTKERKTIFTNHLNQ